MNVTPSINFFDEQSVRGIIPKLKILRERGVDMVHVDVSDGKFTKALMGLTPAFFDSIIGPDFTFELHLMVQDVGVYLKAWSSSKNIGAVVIHPESDFDLADVREFCSARKAALAWSLKLDGNLEDFIDMVEVSGATTVELLSVPIGFSGGNFDESVLERAVFIKKVHPDLKVFIDGGVNEKTAVLMKKNGVDGVVTGSYLWHSSDVGLAYDTLKGI